MAGKLVLFAPPHPRPTGRQCCEANEVKERTSPGSLSELFSPYTFVIVLRLAGFGQQSQIVLGAWGFDGIRDYLAGDMSHMRVTLVRAWACGGASLCVHMRGGREGARWGRGDVG